MRIESHQDARLWKELVLLERYDDRQRPAMVFVEEDRTVASLAENARIFGSRKALDNAAELDGVHAQRIPQTLAKQQPVWLARRPLPLTASHPGMAEAPRRQLWRLGCSHNPWM